MTASAVVLRWIDLTLGRVSTGKRVPLIVDSTGLCWVKGSGLRRNTGDTANEAGRSTTWVSTVRVRIMLCTDGGVTLK